MKCRHTHRKGVAVGGLLGAEVLRVSSVCVEKLCHLSASHINYKLAGSRGGVGWCRAGRLWQAKKTGSLVHGTSTTAIKLP